MKVIINEYFLGKKGRGALEPPAQDVDWEFRCPGVCCGTETVTAIKGIIKAVNFPSESLSLCGKGSMHGTTTPPRAQHIPHQQPGRDEPGLRGGGRLPSQISPAPRGTSNWNPGAAREAAAPSPVLLGARFGAVDLGPFRGFGTGRSRGVGAVLVFWDGRGPGAALFALLSAGLPLDMVNDRNKRGIHTVRGRLGSPRTPMIAFNSVIVTCLARSTAWATCCWCCGDRGARSATGHPPDMVPPLLGPIFPDFFALFWLQQPGGTSRLCGARQQLLWEKGEPLAAFWAQCSPPGEQSPCRAQLRPSQGFSSTQAGFKPHSSHPPRPQRDSALPARRNPGRSCIPSKRVCKSPYLL